MDSSQSHWGEGLNAFYWYQIFTLNTAAVEAKMLSTHGGFLTIAMYHHRETILIKLSHHDETKKRAHDSQIVRAKKLKLSHGGPYYSQASDTRPTIKALHQSHH